MDEKEKKFDLGHRVRIIGPTIKGDETYVGECFTIDQMLVSTDKIHGYSRHDRNQLFPASSLELVKSESDRLDSIEQRLDNIEKRLSAPETDCWSLWQKCSGDNQWSRVELIKKIPNEVKPNENEIAIPSSEDTTIGKRAIINRRVDPLGDPVYHEAIEHPQKLIEIRGLWIVNAHNIAKEWNIGPITTEIKTPVKDNHLIIAIDKLLYRLGSIEKRLQTLEDKARADTSTQKRKDADSGDKGMDLSGFW
jgi:hypothetical protein